MTAKDLRDQAAYLGERAEQMRMAAISAEDLECGVILMNLATSYDDQAALLLRRLGPQSKAVLIV